MVCVQREEVALSIKEVYMLLFAYAIKIFYRIGSDTQFFSINKKCKCNQVKVALPNNTQSHGQIS